MHTKITYQSNLTKRVSLPIPFWSSFKTIMENILKKFDYHITQRAKDEYVLHYKDNYYEIGFLVYQILLYGKECNTLEQLQQKIDRPDITASRLDTIIHSSLMPIFNKMGMYETKKEETPQKDYWCRCKIMPTGKARLVVNLIKPLFGRLYAIVACAVLIANILLYNRLPTMSIEGSAIDIVAEGVIVYALFFAVTFLHEFGHVAAAMQAGLKDRYINFAMYYIFPILYVKLNDTWTLNVWQRTKINLAGVTMQLIVNIPLLVAIILLQGKGAASQVAYITFWMNTIGVVLNLLPFIKFDGYWILSDLLHIPNLMKESTRWLTSFFVKPSPFAPKEAAIHGVRKAFFVLFSLLRPLFMVALVCWGLTFIVYRSVHSYYLLSNLRYMSLSVKTFYNLVPDVLLLVLSAAIIVRYLNTLKKYKKHFTKQ